MELFLKKQEPPRDLRQKISPHEVYDVLIVGGGPAGLTAALYALRKELSTALISPDLGGQVLSTPELENYPGYLKIGGYDLIKKMEEQAVQFPLALEEGAKAVSVKKNDLFEVVLDNGMTLKAKTVILATGKKWRSLEASGEKELVGKGVSYCTTCDAPLFRGKRTAVVGGGNSALEGALELSAIASQVYLIVRKDRFRADGVLVSKVMQAKNIQVLFQHRVASLSGSPMLSKAVLENTDTGQLTELDLDGLFVEIGLIPSTDFILDPKPVFNAQGEIKIDASCKTSVSGLFAAGDVTDTPEKQVVIAAGEGAKAALSAFQYLQHQS